MSCINTSIKNEKRSYKYNYFIIYLYKCIILKLYALKIILCFHSFNLNFKFRLNIYIK